MKTIKHIGIVLTILVCLVIAFLSIEFCSGSSSGNTGIIQSATYSSKEDFDLGNKKVGFLSGTLFEKYMKENYPTAELYYYASDADGVAALSAGKIDALLIDLPIISYMATSLSGLAYIPDPVLTADTCFILPKNSNGAVLQIQLNEFLAELESEGTLSALRTKWLNGIVMDENVEDYTELPATNGTLTFATSSTNAPLSYISQNTNTGFEVEIAIRFCKQYGYGFKVMDLTFDGLLSAMAAGKADFGAACVSYSEERAQSLYFSSPTFSCDGVVVYRQTDEDVARSNQVISNLKELSGRKIGYQIGSVCEESALALAGEKGVALGFNTIEDIAAAVDVGKIDGALVDTSMVSNCIKNHERLVSIGETGKRFEVAAITNPNNEFGKKIQNMLNAWIVESRQNGLLDSLTQKWTSGNYDAEMSIDIDALPAINGRISVGISTTTGAPHCYLRDGKYVGFDIEIMALVAQANGYALDIIDYDFIESLSAVTSGKCDITVGGVVKTEERAEVFDFSDSYYLNNESCIVRTSSHANGSFFVDLVDGFERTFITESRWQLFLSGAGTTLLITLCSLLIGSLIGFTVFRLCFKRGRMINAITDFCVWLITGMPTVVLLMIMFYVVFGSSNLGGVSVSILAFSLIFAAAVIGMLRVGCSAVDSGEIDAATAMGFSQKQIFYRIVLPQAINHILPVYKSETVTLLKGTAIVGYIAVQDLTKVGDIIRARTFEAFFSIVAVAVCYFILAAVLKVIITKAAKWFDPHHRSADRIYKGVVRR